MRIRLLLTLMPAMLMAACSGGGNGDSSSADAPGGQSLVSVGTGSPPTPASPPASDTGPAQRSLNWSGYAQIAGPLSFSTVSGSWIVPAVQCAAGSNTASSTWTGIGGGVPTDPTLIQAGTEQHCIDGEPYYDAWWETIPAPAVPINGGLLGSGEYPVQPGDRITVTVDGSSLLIWNLSIHNESRGWTFNITVPYLAEGATAEWIHEAPLSVGTSGAGQTELAAFDRVEFFALSVNGGNPALVPDQRIAMEDANGNVVSTPSLPAASGDAFSVCGGSGECR